MLSRHSFKNTQTAKAAVLNWCYGFYNHDRWHSTIGMVNPSDYESTAAIEPEAT